MTIDYLASFPIPSKVLPPRLRELLKPVGMSPQNYVEVACMSDFNTPCGNLEHLQMLMAVVPGSESRGVKVLNESGNGVVEYSVPVGDEYSCVSELSPSISGYDYIVAAWGNGSFYTYNLAEKVWMSLGLTPRCVGNDQQQLIYDDLELPEFGVVKGEVSSQYDFSLKRNVSWTMSNEYLRRYLWLRGARGVRVFFYETQLEDVPEIRAIMGGESQIVHKPTEGVSWYELDIREHAGGLRLQLWASVEALMPELCPEQSADGVLWPGYEQAMTHEYANSLTGNHPVYLDDRFLQKYERNLFYKTTPIYYGDRWYCVLACSGQWCFSECQRVGRNLIQVSIRELYKPKPDREILHAHQFAIDPADLSQFDLTEEHVVAKVQRLLDALLSLGDAFKYIGEIVDLHKSASEWTGFDRSKVRDNGWADYPVLARLAQVAPLDMSQQDFLSRCNTLHEVWQRIPNGYLKNLLKCAGCPRQELNGLGSLKLLQAILNIVQDLNSQEEAGDSFVSNQEPEGWRNRNEAMASLFLNNDLRKANAHEAIEGCLDTLQKLGFDTANVNQGYGKALDFVMDGVINSLETVSAAIEKLVGCGDY